MSGSASPDVIYSEQIAKSLEPLWAATLSAECMIDLANDGYTKEQVLDALRVLPLVSFYLS